MSGDATAQKAINLALGTNRALLELTRKVTRPADRNRRAGAAGCAGRCCALVPSTDRGLGPRGRCMRELAAVPRREWSR
jgi:hypothetical protein